MPRFGVRFAAQLHTRVRQAAASYLERGRPLANLDDQALERRFVTTARGWCKHPYNRDIMREFNDINAEYLARGEPVPIVLLKDDVSIFLAGSDAAVSDNAPITMVAVKLDQPLGWAVMYAPFIEALLIPADERYGDGWLHQTQAHARQQAAASPRITSGEAA